VLHFGNTAGTNTSADLYNDLNTNVAVAMWDWVSTGAHVDTVAITPLDGTTATSTFTTGAPAKWTGQASGNAPIPQQAGIIKLSTPLRGRSFSGRIFIPFVDESETSGGTLADVAAVNTAWTTFATAMVTAGWALSVASYKLALSTTVTNLLAESKSATQRRRMDRLR
jgi:hypothetical protein